MSKIAIVFFGITRSLKTTMNSIVNNIVMPCKRIGYTQCYGHFYNLNKIDNPRSAECGELDVTEYKLLKLDWVEIEKPQICLQYRNYSQIANFGDVWNDNYKSLQNLIHQLHSLDIATKAAIADNPDMIVFCRPDLIYHNNFTRTLQQILKKQNDLATIPFWQWNGGLNDRFSICKGTKAAYAYGCRVEKIFDYLNEKNKPLHSEKLLLYSLMASKVRIKPVFLKASRVRIGGNIKQENFIPIKEMGWRQLLQENWLNL